MFDTPCGRSSTGSEMSLKRLALLVAFAIAPAYGTAGEYCLAPTLEAGKVVIVEVENIRTPGCGAAIIDGRYVPLASLRVRQGEISCSTGGCSWFKEYSSEAGVVYPVLFWQNIADDKEAIRYPRIANDQS